MPRLLWPMLGAIALLVSITASQTTSVDYCQALVDVISICEIETSSFTSLPLTVQANCLCGSTLGTLPWGPATFDAFASDCASQYATIQTAVAADAAALEGFCTSYAAGGVQSVTATATSSSNIVLNTGATVPQSSAGVGAVNTDSSQNTDTGLYTTPPTTVGPTAPATTVFSVVTIAQTTSTPTPNGNGAAKYQTLGSRAIVWLFVLEFLVVVAYT